MRSLTRLLVLVVLFSVSFVALAQGTSKVTDLQAELTNGQIHISWTAPADITPAGYHVYYSRESIVENGEYEDFEKTTGKRTDFILSEYPEGSELYIAVLPVDEDGQELGAFVEEVSVILSIASVGAPGAPALPVTEVELVKTESTPPSPAHTPPAPVQQAPSAPTPTPSAPPTQMPLSSSGIGIVALVLASGGIAGWRKLGRK